MKKRSLRAAGGLAGVLALMCLPPAIAGQVPRRPAASLEAMAKLRFLHGEWRGEGWTEQVRGRRATSPVGHVGRSTLGGLVLVLESTGGGAPAGRDEEALPNNCVTVVSYDVRAKVYRVRAYFESGKVLDAEGQLTPEGLSFDYLAPRGVQLTKTIGLNERGKLVETVETKSKEIQELPDYGKKKRKTSDIQQQKIMDYIKG